MPPERRLRIGLVVVAVLAVLTPAVGLLRLAADRGPEPPLVTAGASRSLFDPPPVVQRVPVVPRGASEGRLELPTRALAPLRDVDLGVRLLSLPAGATVRLEGRDEAGQPIVACERPQPTTERATVVRCPVDRPQDVRSVAVTVRDAPGPVRLEGRLGAGGLTAAGLYGDPVPRDLAGRLGRALDRLGVLRPAVASPAVLLGAWAGSLALAGAAFLLLLGPWRPRT